MIESQDIKRLDWLAGTWRGEGFGGECEEIWSRPAGGVMMGMFRLIHEQQLVFYEFMSIEPQGSVPVFRIKHFDPGLLGWESQTESIEFPFVNMAEDSISFDGIAYALDDEGNLVVDMISGEPGSEQERQLVFTRNSSP
jgi:hypothetical protein